MWKSSLSWINLIFYLLVAYGAVSFLTWYFQDRLLYFPDKRVPSKEELHAAGLQTWPFDGAAYRGLISVLDRGGNKGTVVVFHGNAGSALDRIYYIRALEPLGYRVVLAEFPGYGARPGQLGEASFAADAKETVRLVFEGFGGPVFVWGESMGCGVAAWVAADPPVKVSGVVVLTPWDSLPDLAQAIYWFFPARWLVRDRYDNIGHLRAFPGRVAVVLAEQDEVIPIRHGRRLYEGLQGVKRVWVFAGAGHNSWPTNAGAGWWREVMDFMTEKG